MEIDFDYSKGREHEETRREIGDMSSVLINGSRLLLNRIYDSIGFGLIPDEILRHLVIARVSQPASKSATVAYLKSYYVEDVDLSAVYRYFCTSYLRFCTLNDCFRTTQPKMPHNILSGRYICSEFKM